MSRAYRISVKESLSQRVQASDGVSSNLELLPILSKERMGELLAAELVKKGFERQGDTATRKDSDEVTTSVDLKTGEISITAEGHRQVEREATRVAMSERPQDTARETELRESAQNELKRGLAAEEKVLQREVTERLEGHLKDLKSELDGVVNRVMAEALKQRAAELGQVEAIHEEPSGAITIKVRV